MTDRTVLVTGGANGLGAGLVRHFAAAGERVGILDVDTEAGERLAEETGALFVRTDVGDYAAVQAGTQAVAERFGGLDVACLNAGMGGGTGIGADFDPDTYRKTRQVNVDGMVYAANAVLPHLRVRGGGAILITASIAAFAPSPDLYYSMAKHGLIGLTRSLALLLYGDNIKVNALCPGFVDTKAIARIREVLVQHGLPIATPAEIAAMAATVIDSGETGKAWEAQTGQQLTPVPMITLKPVRSVGDDQG